MHDLQVDLNHNPIFIKMANHI